MIVVSVLYPRTDNARFDHNYYREHHLALIIRVYGSRLKHFAALQMLDEQLDGSPSAHVAAAHFMFATTQEFLDAFDEHRDEIVADIEKFTDIQPVIEISDVSTASVDVDGDVDGNQEEGARR